MFNIIPLLLILLSFGVIIYIVVKKFSILANLDVDSIPAEREAKFKEKIINDVTSFLKSQYFQALTSVSGECILKELDK